MCLKRTIFVQLLAVLMVCHSWNMQADLLFDKPLLTSVAAWTQMNIDLLSIRSWFMRIFLPWCQDAQGICHHLYPCSECKLWTNMLDSFWVSNLWSKVAIRSMRPPMLPVGPWRALPKWKREFNTVLLRRKRIPWPMCTSLGYNADCFVEQLLMASETIHKSQWQ